MAEHLMREPTRSEIAQFQRACKTLDKLGRTGFYLYLANNTLNLMVGPPHDEKTVQCQERVRSWFDISMASGGDW